MVSTNTDFEIFGKSNAANDMDLVFQSDGSIERVRFTADGKVGIGTDSPSYKLSIESSAADQLQISRTGVGFWNFNTYASGDLVIDNGTERMRIASGGNVGIKNTSPHAELVVGGYIDTSDVTNGAFRIYNGSTFRGGWGTADWAGGNFGNSPTDLVAYVAGSNNYMIGTGSYPRLTVSGAGSLKFNNYGSGTFTGTATQRLGVDSSGNVIEIPIGSGPVDGSGTANYVTKWSDADTITNSVIYDNGTNVGVGTTNLYARLSVKATSHNNGISVNRAADTTAALYIGNDGGNNAVLAANNADMVFGRDLSGTFTERMRLTNGGNLGIGTTSPGKKLDVAGDWILDGITGGHFENYTYGSQLDVSEITSGGWARANRIVTSDSDGYVFSGVLGNSTTLIRAYWTIGNPSSISDTGYNSSNGIILLKNGNVGIGTTSPTQPLEVNGNIQATGSRTISAQYDSNHYMRLESNSSGGVLRGLDGGVTTVLVRSYGESYFNGGNVGIGTTSPNANLHVYSSGNGEIEVERASGALINFQAQASLGTIGTDSNHPLYFKTNAGTRMAIATSGNVGIGTTSPSFKLDVSGDGIRNIRSTAGWAGWFENTASSSGVVITAGVDSGDAPLLVRKQDATEIFSVRGNGVSWFNAGNVGIGTTSPAQKLEVSFAASVYGARFTRNDAAGSSLIEFANNTGVKSIVGYDAGVDGYRIGTSTANNLTVKQSGNVGIGETSVDARLHITTGSAGLVNQKFESAGSAAWRVGIPASQTYFAFDNANDNLSAPKVVINSSGNVGIGTTTPGSELEVDGEITTTTITYPEPGALDSSAYNGEIVYFGSQISMTEGKLMVLSTSAAGLTWYLAKDSTSSLATGMLGIALGTTASAGLLVRGIAKNSAWSSFSEGEKLYLSPTSGAISNSITGDTNDFVRIIGYALGGNKIYFCPDNSYVQNS